MKVSFKHLRFSQLADLAEGRLTPDDRIAAERHLSACSECQVEVDRLQQVVKLMRTDQSVDAPVELVTQAVNLFRRRESGTAVSLGKRIVAALTFDSWQMSPAYGVRSGQTAGRQLIYNSPNQDIDLRLTPTGDSWVVSGQVLGRGCAGGEVKLSGPSGDSSSLLNQQCEFRLAPVAPGTYCLRLNLTGAEIETPEFEIGL